MNLYSVLIYFSLKTYKYVSKISINRNWERKSERLIKLSKANQLSNEQLKEIKTYYKNLGYSKINTNWHRLYTACNMNFSVAYVPENLFHMTIEPRLNKTKFTEALTDKNLLSTIFDDIKQPETVIKNSNGFYYDSKNSISKEIAQQKCENQKLIIKPTIETGGGKNVIIFTSQNGKTDYKDLTIEALFKVYGKDFIVQKLVNQHPQMRQLNETSLNTFRVMSFLNSTSVDILSIIVRMGKEGAITDNLSTGGLSCGVNQDGSLNEIGFENNTGASHKSTDAGIPFKQIVLPFISEIHALIKKMHKRTPHFQLISWDLAVEESGQLVFIEYNVAGQGINSHQFNNGPVLKTLLKE